MKRLSYCFYNLVIQTSSQYYKQRNYQMNIKYIYIYCNDCKVTFYNWLPSRAQADWTHKLRISCSHKHLTTNWPNQVSRQECWMLLDSWTWFCCWLARELTDCSSLRKVSHRGPQSCCGQAKAFHNWLDPWMSPHRLLRFHCDAEAGFEDFLNPQSKNFAQLSSHSVTLETPTGSEIFRRCSLARTSLDCYRFQSFQPWRQTAIWENSLRRRCFAWPSKCWGLLTEDAFEPIGKCK